MNTDNILKLNLSLEQLSTIAVAKNYWELPNVKEKVYNYLIGYDIRNDHAEEEWDRKVIDYAIEQINLCFPEKLLCNIKILVQILGDKLYSWVTYVIDFLKGDLKYIEKIYWTCNGEIDELKIVNYWLSNSENLGALQHKCFLKKPLFCIAAIYVQEKFIYDHVDELKNEIFQHLLVSHRKKDWSDYAVFVAWLCFCLKKSKAAAVKYFRSFKTLPDLPASELFLLSAKSGFKFAVYHFFDKLDDGMKQRLIGEAAYDCLTYWDIGKAPYEGENLLEILIYLIRNMDDVKKLEFITDHFVYLFKKLLYMWPYQEVCLNLLVNGPSYLPGVHDTLLRKMIKAFSSENNYKAKYFGKGSMYMQIFQTLFEKIPKEVKIKIFTEEKYHFLNALKIFNCDVLNTIINDPDLNDHKSDMIPIVENHLQNLILEGGRYRDVSRLMKLCSNEDKQKYNFLNAFLTAGRIKLAEEHLNWLYDTDGEKLEAKKQIDSVAICTILIKKSRYDLASDYLNWQFNNEEEQKNIKKTMISNGVLCDQVYQIWGMHRESGSLSLVKKKCKELLFWFLESEEAAMEFRKTKLIGNLSFIYKYWNNLFYHCSFVGLSEFLQFCFRSSKKIERIKKQIANNADRWIDTYAVQKNLLLMVDSLFKWVFKDDEERKKVILKYMESPKGALLILNSFKSCNSRSAVLLLLNSWVVSPDPVYISKMKMNLDIFNNGVINENVTSGIKALLDEVKKGHTVSVLDITRKVKNFHR